MANETRITYTDNTKGFYIDEHFMELVFYFIWKTIEPVVSEYEFGEKLEWNAKTAIEGGLHGILGFLWEDFLKNKEHETQMISILEECIKSVENFGEHIPLSELEKSASFTPYKGHRLKWSEPLHSLEVIIVLDALILLLKGEWESGNADLNFNYNGTLS